MTKIEVIKDSETASGGSGAGEVVRIPTQFRKLPKGAKCRCLLVIEKDGDHYCCQANPGKSMMAKRERVWSEHQDEMETVLSTWVHDPSKENADHLRKVAISYLNLYVKD